MPANTEQVFNLFLELPPNIRTEIIDEMEPDDRCRFTRCSKLSNKEAKASKNYMDGMDIRCSDDDAFVLLRFDGLGDYECYSMYVQLPSGDVKIKESWNNRTDWSTHLESSKDLYQCVQEDVRRLFKSHENAVRRLKIKDSSLQNLDIEIELLNNLEELHLSGKNDVRKILSKLHKPLKKLWIEGVDDNSLLDDCKQISEVQHTLGWNHQLNNQQILRVSARRLEIHIGQLTEKDIFNFIRSWQNGTIGKNIAYCRWNWEGSNFNKEKLARLLRLFEVDLNRANAEFEIIHFNEPKKRAGLYFTNAYFQFNADIQKY